MLDDMMLFVEVVRARSFRGAAKALGIPNSTVSRRVGVLEQTIGLRLINRTTRTMELTEAGQVYFDRCQRIVTEARLAHEQLDGMAARPSGTLRASLPVDLAVTKLAPVVADYARRYPEVRVELDLTSRNVSLTAEPFDVAVRIGLGSDAGLIAHKLGEDQPALFASPAYLEQRGRPATPGELSMHDCLPFANRTRWRLVCGARSEDVAVSDRIRVNNVGMIRQLAAQGCGIALLSEELVAADLAAGRLHRVLPDWVGMPLVIYALTETRLLPAKTQAFIAQLREQLGDLGSNQTRGE